jgi:hypothetical protein
MTENQANDVLSAIEDYIFARMSECEEHSSISSAEERKKAILALMRISWKDSWSQSWKDGETRVNSAQCYGEGSSHKI